jgi:hypothetical protein
MAEKIILEDHDSKPEAIHKPIFGIKWERIDSLTLEILMDRLSSVERRAAKMGKEIIKTQEQMETIRELYAEIVNQTNRTTGGLDGKDNAKLQDLLKKAQEFGLTFNNPKGDFVFEKFDRDNLVANLDDLKKSKQTLLNYQTKQVEHLLTEQTESMKFAHKIEQTQSEIKRKVASHIKGG